MLLVEIEEEVAEEKELALEMWRASRQANSALDGYCLVEFNSLNVRIIRLRRIML